MLNNDIPCLHEFGKKIYVVSDDHSLCKSTQYIWCSSILIANIYMYLQGLMFKNRVELSRIELQSTYVQGIILHVGMKKNL